jgi:hypothetical protein
MLNQPQSTGKIYVAEPWASLLVTGKKEIETAHTRLPGQYIGRWLDVQAAGGRCLGRVWFSGYKRYNSAEEFDRDYELHLVPAGDRFHYDNRRQTFGWEVERFEAGEPHTVKPMRSQYRLELYK